MGCACPSRVLPPMSSSSPSPLSPLASSMPVCCHHKRSLVADAEKAVSRHHPGGEREVLYRRAITIAAGDAPSSSSSPLRTATAPRRRRRSAIDIHGIGGAPVRPPRGPLPKAPYARPILIIALSSKVGGVVVRQARDIDPSRRCSRRGSTPARLRRRRPPWKEIPSRNA